MTLNDQPIQSFPGLGPKSQAMLTAAGIESIERLKALGAVRAFLMVKHTAFKPTLNLLWGLESATTGVPWQTIARQNRLPLLMELEALEKDLARDA